MTSSNDYAIFTKAPLHGRVISQNTVNSVDNENSSDDPYIYNSLFWKTQGLYPKGAENR